MLMKMSQYKSVMFTVSICIGSILLAILVAYACDSLKEARDKASEEYRDAQQALSDHEANMAMALIGVPAVASAGGGITAAVKEQTIAVIRNTRVVPAVYLGATFISGTWYFVELYNKTTAVEEKAAAYAAARDAYEACANPPQTYTYTDYGGHVYEFSDKSSYNDFLRNRGLSTI